MKILLRIHYITLPLLFLLPTILNAQKNHKWDKTIDPSPAIPEQFKDADAVMIYDSEKRQTYYEDYRFFSRNIIKRRIKIQTQRGLEKYARIFLPKKSGMHSAILDARTIKQDGTVVDLDAKNDIKAIELSDDDDFLDRSRYDVFSIPGVAIGDEIEIVSIQEGYTIKRGATVILHDFIPILKSTFSVETYNNGILVMATNRNDMAQPQTDNSLNKFSLTWSGTNLAGLYEERGNISARSLPHFIYELNLDRLYKNSAPPNIKSWKDLLHYNNREIFDVRIRKSRKFDEVFNAIMSTAKGDSELDKITAIQHYLNEVKLIKIPEKEASEGVEYFLKKKEGDYSMLMAMYKSLLEKMDIDYLLAAGRSKYVGPIELNFPTFLQITDYLFLLPDENGNSMVLPTKSRTRTYNINEIPLELYDTDIYMISPKDKELFQTVSLTGPSHKKSLRLRKQKAMVQLAEGKIQYKAEETFSGALSTRHRNRHYEALEEESMEEYLTNYLEDMDIAGVDTFSLSEQGPVSPYRYKLFYDFKTENQIVELEEKVYKLSIDNFLAHNIQKASKNRLLDYYPPHPYTDGYNYYIQFDQAVKLSNKENIDRKVDNEIGSFSLNVKQVNPTTILLSSKYIIKASRIPVEKVQQLIDLSEAAEKADNEGLILEVE